MKKRVFKAKPVVVPDRVVAQLDSLKLAVGPNHDITLSDIIADMGELRRRDNWFLAVGLMRTFQELLNSHVRLNHQKFGLDTFSDVLAGIMISHTLGMGKWDKQMPVFMPELMSYEEMNSYDEIELRNGHKYSPYELIHRIHDMTDKHALGELFDIVCKKSLTGKRKDMSVMDRVKVLLAMIEVADEKL